MTEVLHFMDIGLKRDTYIREKFVAAFFPPVARREHRSFETHIKKIGVFLSFFWSLICDYYFLQVELRVQSSPANSP